MIQNGSSVSIEYTLKLDDGTPVDTNVGEDLLTYEQGAGEILPALEAALAGHRVGDTKTVSLTAEQGYGAIDPEAYREVDLEVVPEGSREVGSAMVARNPQGQETPIRVHEVREQSIILDFNHPLAGEALNFDVKIVKIE